MARRNQHHFAAGRRADADPDRRHDGETPFLNNAATVLVVAPIAAGFAESLSYRPEAFLMAVAIGAGCDSSLRLATSATHLSWAPAAIVSATTHGSACRYRCW